MTSPALVPLPVEMRVGDGGAFALTAETTIDGDADAAAALRDLITARTGATPAGGGAPIHLAVEPGGVAESYRLAVDAASVTIAGADAAGLFYGVQTLAQLISRTAGGWQIPAVRIADRPRFAYRGIMLDVARHFHGPGTVRAVIDRAAALKLNVLHLHLTDDQGWRIELTSRPELTAAASGTAVGGDRGGFFTQAEYRSLIDYAAARHMTVVPEIDVPGHTHAVSLAFPAIAAAPVITDEIREATGTFGGALPQVGVPYEGVAVGFSSLRIGDPATSAFLADVFGELAALTPGPYLHLGGDEALGTPPEEFAAFVAEVSALVAGHGKRPIAWHEAGVAAGLDPRTVGQYWGFVTPTTGAAAAAQAFVARDSQLILSPADAVYLDMKPAPDFPLGLTWANGPTSAQRAYEWEPAAVVAGAGDAQILGVEAPLWTETVRTLADIDALAFPRVAAAAEAAWSPATGTHPERTWDSFRRRVGAQGPLWEALGIRFTALEEIPWPHP